jgi:hypothetical protein
LPIARGGGCRQASAGRMDSHYLFERFAGMMG